MLIPWQAPEKQLLFCSLQTTETTIILYLQMTKTYAFCPSCGSQSKHQHSFYTRELQDLSVGSQHVLIRLQSRKWFCVEADCQQRIFTERFSWLLPYARKTERLQQFLRKLAFSMSCRQAERVAQSCLRRVSHDTFLRLIRSTTIALPQTTAIGIDDFAFRKGHDYGTLICDLNTHQPLAILPSRTSETVESWLVAHSPIQTVSRDGSKTYREAITNANAAIQQISDRWHLIKNAKEALSKWLEQKLPAQIEWSIEHEHQIAELPNEKPIDEPRWQLIQRVQQDHKEGVRISYLAKKYELSRGTIYKYVKQVTPPQKTKRKTKPAQAKLQPYYELIVAYDTEHLTTNQILKRIRLAGYDGSLSALRRFIEPYRANKKKGYTQALIHQISRTKISQWIWRGFQQLNDEQKQVLEKCQHLYPFLEPLEKIVQEYRTIFENRAIEPLIDWMNTQLVNKNSPFHRYSTGLRLDVAAVKNAFASPYSNGLLEGQVNRLKWMKRMMYGRAKPDLLEKRMQYQF
ncbi:ISL3 family transposase [Lysinibacillus sp. FSL H8-0500]|uniref:ISL3 family transposase n=1 Tax=Lysinibacillus sp. FSL H8-0500 TaxID=2921393 RepID=UPI003101156D